MLDLQGMMASEGAGDYAAQSLDASVKRMNMNLHCYRGADAVTSTFRFVTRVVEAWHPHGEGIATES